MRNIFTIKIDVSDVGEFVKAANDISNDINLFQGTYVVSGKSLMGICALDFSKPIKLTIRDVSNDTFVADKFEKWIVKE